ncbi:SusD/RagB family nutrient-binding outer membrane lipoprotein [Puia sp. P3]|uniref:SusD/RagB family nutrient-binding outer membrane lipoprotein n=1 Tax=Puia sp. P3 TaxID=3423952 RepID=UPI003D6745D3
MKRTFFIKTIFSLVAAAGVLSGCKKQLDINHNPNFPSPDQATAKIVFPVAVVGTIAKTGGDMAIVGGIWGQYFTQSALASQFRTVDAYNMTNSDFFTNDVFTDLYTLGLKNYQFVQDKAKAASDWNYYLVATVMKGYTAAFLVDLYDSIPYSQALSGTGNLNPKFDDGYSVYTSVIKSIDSALGKDFTAETNTIPGGEDLVFGGDMDLWKQFANTLKLKLYLRMINKHADVAQAGIQAMYTSGAKFLTSDAAVTNFKDNPSQDNPFFEYNQRTLNTTSNLRASKTFTSWMAANNDTLRAKAFFSVYHPLAQDQGDYGNTSAGAVSNVFVQSPTDPVELISAAESYFMQAEAVEQFGVAGNSQSLYESGVTAAFANLNTGCVSLYCSRRCL